jgi:hypothetical protein
MHCYSECQHFRGTSSFTTKVNDDAFGLLTAKTVVTEIHDKERGHNALWINKSKKELRDKWTSSRPQC